MNEVQPFDEIQCAQIVQKYMQRNGWQLIDAQTLSAPIWDAVRAQKLSSQAAVAYVKNQVWQQYAEILHQACRESTGSTYEQAWAELLAWLENQIGYLPTAVQDTDRLAQETLLSLHDRLTKEPLKSPRAFLAFALQTLKRKNIDLHRKDMAVKRGGGDGLYLEEIPFRSMDADGDDPHWEDAIPDTAKDAQYIEETTAMQDIRQKMQAFFRTYLTSDLQIQVAEAHFLDGLTPKEIAQLMGKHSHEIRMLKARVIQQLRSLPQEKRQILLEILSVATDLSFNEVDDE